MLLLPDCNKHYLYFACHVKQNEQTRIQGESKAKVNMLQNYLQRKHQLQVSMQQLQRQGVQNQQQQQQQQVTLQQQQAQVQVNHCISGDVVETRGSFQTCHV